ncbi:MAG: 1-acyl-sn-glycerol-3-phosphate acyltransferase [Holophagaceae bacterium]|nr:1-acyl-sn-glycerol-3-phosphate acyltransferase [Holophagaceae bacterium]
MTAPRPFLRPLLVWIFGCPALAVAVCLAYLTALFRWSGAKGFWAIAPGYIRLMAWLFGIRRSLEGWEDLPLDIREGRQAAIFVGNHTSLLDPPLIIATLPSHPVFMAKRELAYVPFLGWVIWLADFIFINRSHRGEAIKSLALAAKRIHDGQSIAAFPEGTRSRTGELLPFKKGVFNLAWEAQVPMIPVAILGGRHILPADGWRVSPGPYHLRLGSPVSPRDFQNAEALRSALHDRVQALLKAP